jgi:hopanoid biosynthesis associated protein HpnK
MDRQIIINADDFGLCEGVNRAVAEAHTKGILTSATIMTNMPAAAEAIEISRQLPGLGVGVHLNLTDGQPVSKDADVQLLVKSDGQFAYSPARLSFYALVSPRFRNAVKAELAAQIRWAVEKDLRLTHLDSHKHIHSFPVIYPLVCNLARQFEIPAIRFTYEPRSFSAMPGLPLSGDGKKRARLTRIMARINRLQNPSFFKTDMLLGVAHTGKINTDFFRAVALYNGAPVAEIMTHPGFTDGLEKFKTKLVQQRKIELDTLCSEKTRQYLINAGIKLVHYGQL